ncbi:unnamed protein product [Ostreobium quekettii]|uniref:PLC-like phosphodiesterase, TIM beta/alpha-barrel domain n=1 Tax=Ostreobium quekettii TaxID=121088 RepID=A0A8S1IYQ9_9CHLO|nr:unnamed protein product [Ostreobium quekettii]
MAMKSVARRRPPTSRALRHLLLCMILHYSFGQQPRLNEIQVLRMAPRTGVQFGPLAHSPVLFAVAAASSLVRDLSARRRLHAGDTCAQQLPLGARGCAATVLSQPPCAECSGEPGLGDARHPVSGVCGRVPSIAGLSTGFPEPLEYSHPRLSDLLSEYGVRAFELDVFYDPDGDFLGESTVGLLNTLLSASSGEPMSLATSLPVDASAFRTLEQEVLDVFNLTHLITPDELRGNESTLAEAVLENNGWPELVALRGRIVLTASEPFLDDLLDLHPNLVGSLMFPTATEDTIDPSHTVFVNVGTLDAALQSPRSSWDGQVCEVIDFVPKGQPTNESGAGGGEEQDAGMRKMGPSGEDGNSGSEEG